MTPTLTPADVSAAPQVVYVEKAGNGLATASLVCGIVGATIALIPILGILGLASGLVALVLGLIARRRAAGRGRATAGAILGVVAVGLGILGLVIVNNAVNELDDDLDRLADTPSATVSSIDEALAECDTSPTGYVIAIMDDDADTFTVNCETGEALDGMWNFGD